MAFQIRLFSFEKSRVEDSEEAFAEFEEIHQAALRRFTVLFAAILPSFDCLLRLGLGFISLHRVLPNTPSLSAFAQVSIFRSMLPAL